MRLTELLSVIPDSQEIVVCRESENGYALDEVAVYGGLYGDGDSWITELNEARVNEVYEYGGDIRIVIDAER